MLFDQYISAETDIDFLKMESVKQSMQTVISKLSEEDIKDKKKYLTTLDYALHYIGRCQMTFQVNAEELRRLEKQNAEYRLRIENMQGQISSLQQTIQSIK